MHALLVHEFFLSITNGQAIITDMARTARLATTGDPLASYLERLDDLPFVRQVEVTDREGIAGPHRFDAVIRLETDTEACEYYVETKRSYLDAPITRAILSLGKQLAQQNKRLLLLARYIPRPTAQQLIEGGVDFIDLAGNIHLNPSTGCHWTVIGKLEQRDRGQRPMRTAATLQILFTIAAYPESATWTVRELAAAAGVSKSKAATARRDLVEEGTIRETEDRFQAPHPRDLADQLLSGYRQILRHRLVIGRYRPPEEKIENFLSRLQERAKVDGFQYSLTGGPAAYLLQSFYKGTQAPIFVESTSSRFARQLRLLPDREGPVSLLRAFGDLVFWRTRGDTNLAHPWLIYAELMSEADPRAHEAAEELRQEFLSQ